MLVMVPSLAAVSIAINRIPWLRQFKTDSSYKALLDPTKKLVPPFITNVPNDSINNKRYFN